MSGKVIIKDQVKLFTSDPIEKCLTIDSKILWSNVFWSGLMPFGLWQDEIETEPTVRHYVPYLPAKRRYSKYSFLYVEICPIHVL